MDIEQTILEGQFIDGMLEGNVSTYPLFLPSLLSFFLLFFLFLAHTRIFYSQFFFDHSLICFLFLYLACFLNFVFFGQFSPILKLRLAHSLIDLHRLLNSFESIFCFY